MCKHTPAWNRQTDGYIIAKKRVSYAEALKNRRARSPLTPLNSRNYSNNKQNSANVKIIMILRQKLTETLEMFMQYATKMHSQLHVRRSTTIM